MSKPWESIRGWLFEGEAEALAEVALNKTVLEIGSYCGKSTAALASTAYRVYSVDWHRGDASIDEKLVSDGKVPVEEDTLAEFRQNMVDRCMGNVVALVGRTEQMDVLGESWADVAFVDGAHDTVSAAIDLRLAKRCLRNGGTLVLHDWDRESVRDALHDVFRVIHIPGRRVNTLMVFDAVDKVEGTQPTVLTHDQLVSELAALDQQRQQVLDQQKELDGKVDAIHGARQMTLHLMSKVGARQLQEQA